MAHLTSHIAALTVELSPDTRTVKLLPAGEFRARDGRPAECAAWRLDTSAEFRLIANAESRTVPFVIDYEHQTLRAAENGKPAPASAWFHALEWRDDGLYATDVAWTAAASAMIAAKEYRYLSPVFTYDAQGWVTGLLHVALTNNPALDELPELQVAALSRLLPGFLSHVSKEDFAMDELVEPLCWLLNLPKGSGVDQIKGAMPKLIDQLSGGQGLAAASVNLPQLLTEQTARIAALSASQADPARFVSVDTMRELQGQVSALTTQLQGREVGELVTAALSDGRLLPAQETWARELGASNLAQLQSYLATAPKIAALATTQTGGKPPVDEATGLDAETLAVCQLFGNDPQQLIAAQKEQTP